MDYSQLVDQYLETGGKVTTLPDGSADGHVPPQRETPRAKARRQRVRAMVEQKHSAREIARALDVSLPTVYQDLKALGAKIAKAPRRDKAVDQRDARVARAREELRDRRRFKVTPVPMGEYGVLADHAQEGTIFEGKRQTPSAADRVLTDGKSNSKIGGDVLVGRLKGARIFTLTLEERATCPRSCRHWQGCYGNAMPWSTRWAHGDDLVTSLAWEIADLCRSFETVLIRLHILGDFWSLDYVEFWFDMLMKHDNLHVFGFTAWQPTTDIGMAISTGRDQFGLRFAIRHSDTTGRWGTFTLPEGPAPYPLRETHVGDALICPEQRDAINDSSKGTHCGSCGACWQGDKPIVFIIHGKKLT